MSIEFMEWLERQLIRNNIFACDLAKKLRMSQNTISCYRHGKRKPRYTTVVALCAALDDDPERVWRLVGRERKHG